MAETKEKLLRVLQIMQRTDEKTPINAHDIIEKLSNEFGIDNVDRKSIYRDMALLEKVGYHICQCDNVRSGWYMDQHAFEDWELKLLIDTCMQTSCISAKDTSTLINKLQNMASERGRARFNRIFVPANHNKITPEASNLNNQIETILEAVYSRKKLQFKYVTYDSNLKRVLRHGGQVYELSLYSLYYSKNTYYLIGCDNHHEGLSNYRLDRIEELTISEDAIIPPETALGKNAALSLQSYIETRVDNFGGEKVRLVLECVPNDTSMLILKDFAGNEGDVSVGSQPVIRHLNNGNIQVTLMKQYSPTLINWIMQYSNMFWVVEPANVRTEVIQRLQESMNRYL